MIWRRLQVPSWYTFDQFHGEIQAAMGWVGYHLYSFRIKGVTLALPDRNYTLGDSGSDSDDDDAPAAGLGILGFLGLFGGGMNRDMNSAKHKISEFFTKKGDKATYLYDFGDSWEHRITLSKIFRAVDGVDYPVVIGGKRACPPEGEDCIETDKSDTVDIQLHMKLHNFLQIAVVPMAMNDC